MKILVTGASGLVGSEAVKFFEEKGWEVTGLDNNMRSHFFGVEKDEIDTPVDIRDEMAIGILFKDHKFDAILHTAAQPSHDYSKDHVMEDFDINARGTLLLLEATRKYCPDATFVHISTDKVYGENMKGKKLSDEKLGLDFAGCRSPFGCSKTAADIYVQEYGNYFGMKTVCFRCGCITGKNHKGAELHGFLAYLVKCIKQEIPYNIFGYKGKQVRDQIHAYDLVSACYEFIKNPKIGAVYNMGGGEERATNILEAVKIIEHETGNKAIVKMIDKPRKGDRIYDIHDISKFKKDYPNWNYKYSLQDIVKELCQTS